MTRPFAFAAAVLLVGSGLAGCSDQPAVCDAVDELQASVGNLEDLSISENGVGAISDSLSAIKTDLRQVKAEAEAEYATQVDAVDAGIAELTSSVDTAQQGPTAATLGAVGAAVSGLVDDVTALVEDVSSTC
jgi:hypothetical protein